MAQWKGKLYAGVSDTSGAVLSSTTGSSWTRDFGAASKDSFGEVLSLVPLPDALYAFWVEQWGSGDFEANKKVDCYRLTGKTWEPMKLLPGVQAVWNTKVLGDFALLLLPGRSYRLKDAKAVPEPASEGINPADVEEYGGYLYWLASADKEGWAVYRTPCDSAKGTIGERTKLLSLPAGLSGNSLAVHGKRLYVGCNGKPSGQLISVDLDALNGA